MTAFDSAFETLMEHEGGYVNHPDDPGGETRYGISKRSYPSEDIANLTISRAREIYLRDYWHKVSGDLLPPAVALVTFDAAVNSGVARAVRWLQLAVDAVPDGIIGPRTLAAVRASNPEDLVVELLEMRLAFMESLPTYGTFGRGWRRRIIDLAVQVGGRRNG